MNLYKPLLLGALLMPYEAAQANQQNPEPKTLEARCESEPQTFSQIKPDYNIFSKSLEWTEKQKKEYWNSLEQDNQRLLTLAYSPKLKQKLTKDNQDKIDKYIRQLKQEDIEKLSKKYPMINPKDKAKLSQEDKIILYMDFQLEESKKPLNIFSLPLF